MEVMSSNMWSRFCAGGQSSLADFCAYFVAYSDGSCTDINSARSPDRMLGEMRGEDSR
jgi:leishmanolysin